MNTRMKLRQRAAWALAAALFLIHGAAQACEGCKQAVGMGDGAGGSRVVNGVGVGYALSIGMLLCMVFGVVMMIGWMAYRNCQAIAAYQRAALAAEDAANGFDGALPVGGQA